MADQGQNKPSFSFAAPTGTTPSSSSLFGGATNTMSPAKPGGNSSSIFGSGQAAPPSSGGLFGNLGGQTAPAKPLFGSGSSSATFGSQPSVFSFAAASTAPAAPATPATPTGTDATNPGTKSTGTGMFGSQAALTTPNKSSDSAPAAQNSQPTLFGSAPQAAESKPLFGEKSDAAPTMGATTPQNKPASAFLGASTTPAGPPPTASVFGSTTGPSSFKIDKPAGDNSAPKPSGSSLFPSMGKPADTSGKAPASNAPPTISSTPNLFGSKPSKLNQSLFGNIAKTSKEEPPKPSEPSKNVNEQMKSSTGTPFSFPSNAPGSNSSDKPAASSLFNFQKPGQTTNDTGNVKSATSLSNPMSNASSTNVAASSSLFGGPKEDASKGAASSPFDMGKSDKPANNASTSNTGSSLFSGAQKPTTTTAAKPGNQGESKDGTNASASSAKPPSNTLTSSTIGPKPPSHSRLNNKSMEDIIARWASDLAKYQKQFQAQAEKVASWDRMLTDNSEKIQRLYGQTLEAERATIEVERQLSSVENDQAELESWLNHYEQEVDDLIKAQGTMDGYSTGPDKERDHTYRLAGRLSEKMDEMGRDLTSMIEEINEASSNLNRTSKKDDPLSQVVRVLNSHLTQLQQIDQGAAALTAKVQEAQRNAQSTGPFGANRLGTSLARSRDGSQRFSPAPPNAPFALGNGDAADGFYRSFMGRR